MLLCLCVCVHQQTRSLPHKCTHKILLLFFPGNLVVLWGWLRAYRGPKIWQDPGVEGRQEPAAEERQGKLLKLWPEPCCLYICSSALSNHLEPHSTESMTISEESSFAFLMWIVLLSLQLLLKALFVDYDTRTTWIRISTPKPGWDHNGGD